jgi:glutathione S-transferase
MPILHQMPISGNCYKVRLVAHQAGVPLQFKDYPLHVGTTRKPEFLSKNPNGRVPLLEFEDGRFLPESGAILWHLSEGTKLQPADAWGRAQALQWMFFEQYSHEPNIATLRYWLAFVGEAHLSEQQRAQIPAKRIAGEDALTLMDEHLAGREWFVGECVSLADIALYAYTHVAEAGCFRLRERRNVCDWLDSVAALPGYVPMS